MKAAVYCGTRNLYDDMVTAAKSLLVHSDVDKIYFLIEDDVFPHKLPKCIEAINVSGQKWFSENGPNYRRKWTWMVMMRAALSKVFPDLDEILSLDVDTIVIDDISEIWEVPLGDYYLAACREPLKSEHRLYINMGVALLNLRKLRDGMDDRIIHSLNTRSYEFAEQDCINKLCSGGILAIDGMYNVSDFTEKSNGRKIMHYACKKDWREYPTVKKYRQLPWDKVRGGL